MTEYRVTDGVVEQYLIEGAGWFPVSPDDLIPLLFQSVIQLQHEVEELKYQPFNPNFW
jgi:hypothetical protein